jgi:TonB-dependent SusC/RagA subfamily outer membrane receptor
MRLGVLAGVAIMTVRPFSPATSNALSAQAQTVRSAIVFVSTPAETQVADSASADSRLLRKVTLNIRKERLADALREIDTQADLKLNYGDRLLALNMPVTIVAADITAQDALAHVLRGTGMQVARTSGGALLLQLATATSSGRERSVLVHGKVVDSKTNVGIAGASVALSDPAKGVKSAADGSFTIDAVAPGMHTISVRRLGYLPTMRTILVDTADVVLEFRLVASPLQLEQVVTTATGPAREVELGNATTTLAADSLSANAPITDLSDILSARVPSVGVYVDGGLTGASPQITIRGQNSLYASNQPIVYVDGARVDNTSATNGVAGVTLTTTGGHLNDINPEQIESIEVVKGPAAATLYGTDAANGVILIRTKQGTPGSTRWSGYSEQGILDPVGVNGLPSPYYGWGHTLDGTNTPTNCTLVEVGAQQCAQDSLTDFSPLKNSQTTPFGQGSRQTYGAQVSGGNSVTRYFGSADYQDEIGYLKMPQADLAILQAQRGAEGVSFHELHPNEAQRLSGRENVIFDLGRTGDVTVAASAISLSSYLPPSSAIESGLYGSGYRDSTDGWGYGTRPSLAFAGRNTDFATHLTGSITPSWRPFDFLSFRATVGSDYAIDEQDIQKNPDEGGPANPNGLVASAKTSSVLMNADAVGTASFALAASIRSQTAVGVNYTRSDYRQLGESASNLGWGCKLLTCAGSIQPSTQIETQKVVAGAFVEQTFSVADRLFLKGGLRDDGGSSFGRSTTELYPKVSVSWLAIGDPSGPGRYAVSSLRIRGAWGASGVQPNPTDALTLEQEYTVFNGTTTITGSSLQLGNPSLRPERQQEVEAGFDAGLWGERIQIQATYFWKRSSDALNQITLPISLGGTYETVNLGAVSNTGGELLVSLYPIKTHAISAGLTVSGSLVNNKLISVDSAAYLTTPAAPFVYQSPGYRIGFPLDEWSGPTIGYANPSHGGIVVPSEVTFGSPNHYVGPSYPPYMATLSPRLGFLSDKIRLSAQFDYRGGFYTLDGDDYYACLFGTCRALYDRTSSKQAQANALALQQGDLLGYVSNSTFTRLREVAISCDLPSAWIRPLRVRYATLLLAARNVALWTHYAGADPEEAGIDASGLHGGAYAPVGGIVPSQYWLARLALGF